MDCDAPHTFMKSMRRIAVYISSDNQWYPARDYQEFAIKDFMEVIDKYVNVYHQMYTSGISVNRELTKQYTFEDDIHFNLSFDVTKKSSEDFVININTFNLEKEEFITHLATIYQSYQTVSHLKSHPTISKIGTISKELEEFIEKDNY